MKAVSMYQYIFSSYGTVKKKEMSRNFEYFPNFDHLGYTLED